jgi:hypothetical protein
VEVPLRSSSRGVVVGKSMGKGKGQGESKGLCSRGEQNRHPPTGLAFSPNPADSARPPPPTKDATLLTSTPTACTSSSEGGW